MKGWLRWVFRPALCFGGLVGGLIFFWISLTPSLLPRAWFFQGAVSGIAAAIGYGLGSAGSALIRKVLPSEPSPTTKRIAWWVLAGVTGVATILLLWQSHRWQNELRGLMGMGDESNFSGIGVVLLVAVVGALLLVGARILRSFGRFIVRQVDRIAPRAVSVPVGFVLSLLLVVGFAQGVLWRGVVAVLNEGSSVANGRTNPDSMRPTTSNRSGGPDSLVSWESLGRQGRAFIGEGPTRADLEAAQVPRCCSTPIRVYVGLDSAGSPKARADLAVRELERTGGFDRSVLGIFTATGTGWINPKVADSLEYIHGGDTAEVSMQYSFLPSWMSFLVDQTKAEEAGQALIGAVLRHVHELPPQRRPKVLLYGESLGSYGTERAFADLADMRANVDGALLVGPTFTNPIWKHLTATREPGSPEWLPKLPAEAGVHFAGTPADLAGVADSGPEPRVVYLQNASDPITWWNLDLAIRKPAWAGSPAAPDRSPAFRWFPVVTFVQTGVDLADSLGVPAGHGHYFGENVVDGWVAVDKPVGWTATDTARVRARVAPLDETPDF